MMRVLTARTRLICAAHGAKGVANVAQRTSNVSLVGALVPVESLPRERKDWLLGRYSLRVALVQEQASVLPLL